MNTLGVRETMRLEVKHVTALDSTLPSVEIEKLLR